MIENRFRIIIKLNNLLVKMNPKTIYWIDKNIGRLICFFLTLHRRFFEIFKKNSTPYIEPSKIIFIKLIEQGSTVLAYSALERATDSVGKENLYFLVFKENRPILDILDLIPVSNIIEIDSGSFGRFILSVIKALVKIRKEKIDAVVDMEFFSRASAILSYLSGVAKRVGFHKFSCEGPYRGDLFTHRLIYNPYLHIRRLFNVLVEALNHASFPDNTPMVFRVPNAEDICFEFLSNEGEESELLKKIEDLKGAALNRPVIILNPNTADILSIRKWPQQNFITLGRMILAQFPQATIILTGTAKEKKEVDILASQIGMAVSLAGRTSLRELLTLYCISDVLVTSDSGPAHFAKLTPIKSIVLFGPETPLLYGGGNGEELVPDVVCSPCLNVYNHRRSPCKNNICLRAITPDMVYQKLKGVLQKSSVLSQEKSISI